MRALCYDGAGGVEVLSLREVPDPVPGPGQVRVRVHAAGLNRADILQRKGGYAAPPGWPAEIPGLEYAGELESLGPDVSGWKPGDRVMGLVGGGAHAELLVTAADELLPLPAELSWTEGAAIPESFLTAHDALTRARLASGERLLIHAAASGLGTAAIQLAREAGAFVIGTSRSEGKLAALHALGLDQAILTAGRPFREQLDAPVDVVLDVLGGGSFDANLDALAPRGRLVLLGLLQGAEATVRLDLILRKRLEVIGSVMRTRGPEERAALVAGFRARILPLFGPHVASEEPLRSAGRPERRAGSLRPVVHAVLPLRHAALAHAAMERSEPIGKLVLAVSSDR